MFRFKRFDVAQSGAAMKVGTDGVLLGAWCPMGHHPTRVLDIGTGTGLIAMMAVQRGEAWGCSVDAVEIDPQAAEQARTNFAASPWTERLKVYNSSVQDFLGFGYGLIVSNPPFFSDSLIPPDGRRALARHTGALSYSELARCAAAALGTKGVFAVIVPFDHAASLIAAAAQHGLLLFRRLDVRPTHERPPHRSLLAFGRGEVSLEHNSITIETSRHEYTPQYRELTREFYLKF